MKIAVIGNVKEYSRRSIEVWLAEVSDGLELICGSGVENFVPCKVNHTKVNYKDYASEFEAIENADCVVIFKGQKKYIDHMDYLKNQGIICAIVSKDR